MNAVNQQPPRFPEVPSPLPAAAFVCRERPPSAGSPRRLGLVAVAASVLLSLALATGCKGKSGGEGRAGVGGAGRAIAMASAADLRVSPDGRFATFLADGTKPKLDGIPPQMLLGTLHLASLSGNESQPVGTGVTNVPGGQLFSPDSRFLFFLTGFNPAQQSGELKVARTDAPKEPARTLGAAVTYFVPSADSKRLAFVDGGQLKLVDLSGGEPRALAGEATTAQFTPDGKVLFFKRHVSAAGGLYWIDLGDERGSPTPKKLGDQVGDFAFSPDSKRVVFATRSEVVRSTYDLWIASQPEWKAKQIAQGTALFAFSPDGKWLGRIEGTKPELIGDLYVGPADGSPGRKVAERVQEFSFAPDSTAVASLEHYDIPSRAGKVSVTKLPDGKPVRVGERSPNFVWGSDGRFLAFLQRFVSPSYSVDLMLYPVGEEKAFKVHPGVFGYGFGAKNEQLFLRSSCIRNGRACDLFAVDLSKPKEPPKKILDGIYNFKPSENGERLLISYARLESDTYDTGIYNLKTGQRKTLEQTTQLPAVLLDDAGSKVAYLVVDRKRAGLYVAEQVP